jgi:spore maturation protein CgeB
MGIRDICRCFDLCWTSTLDALEKYCVEGATPLYLPEGANPEIHRPYEVEKTFDVSFVGQCYENRPAVIDALRKAGIRVEAFGPGWPDGPLSTGEMVRTYSRSRVNLGFGGVAGHKDTYCLKGRDFEVPMSGGLYLTEAYEELERFYEVGKEIVTYSGVEDLVEKIRWLLSNPGEAEAIRQAGRRRALSGHTWGMRFDRVFRVIGALA